MSRRSGSGVGGGCKILEIDGYERGVGGTCFDERIRWDMKADRR